MSGPDPETVYRVCPFLRDLKPCMRCTTEMFDGEPYTRGCFALAREIVNVVETGNPWRKEAA